MFSYYKNLISNTLKFQGIEDGAAPVDAIEAYKAEQSVQAELAEAKAKLATMEGADVATLEEAVKEIPAEAREAAGNLLLDTVIQRIVDNNSQFRDGQFESATFGKGIQFDGKGFFDLDGISSKDVYTLAKYGIDQKAIIASLNNHLGELQRIGTTQRGASAEEMLAYQASQKPRAIIQDGGDGSEALIAEMDASRSEAEAKALTTAQNEASDERLIARAQEMRRQEGKTMLAKYVEELFTQNPNYISEEFHTESNGIEIDDGIFKDTQVMGEDMMKELNGRGITSEEIVAAFDNFKQTQIARNTMNQYADARSKDVQAEAQRKTAEGYKQYADARREGERIAAMDKAYAGMPIDARTQGAQNREVYAMKSEAQQKLAELAASGEIRASEIRNNPDLTRAVQTALFENLGAEKIQKITGRPDMTLEKFADGKYGNWTKAVAGEFQRGNELVDDGAVGKQTLMALLDTSIISDPISPNGVMMADTPELEEDKKVA